jgi:2-methylcitrate dehydratase PrpD
MATLALSPSKSPRRNVFGDLPHNERAPALPIRGDIMTSPDYAKQFARIAAGSDADAIPAEAVSACKSFVLDTIGVAIAGTTASGFEQALRLEGQWGGHAQSTVIASRVKLSTPQAAFLNGIAIHARDFDDTHDVAIVHANASVFPSALAAAEQRKNVSGKEFIAALIWGIDLACRLGLALKHYVGWHYSSICGSLGAASAAARVLRLDEQRMSHALGIAFAQAAGNIQAIRDGALTKRMQLGFAARAGLTSAYLAESGITGTTNTIQGPYGFLRMFDTPRAFDSAQIRHRDNGEHGEHELMSQLGSRFEVTNLSMKPYPNCRATHPAIDAVLELIAEHAIAADQIERVVVVASKRTFERVGKKFDVRDEGPLQVVAQFSMAYAVAVAACRGKVTLSDFEESNIRDPHVFAMMDRVDMRIDETFSENIPVSVAISLKDGRCYAKKIGYLKGSPSAPLSDTEIAAKFSQCCELSSHPFSHEKIAAIIKTVDRLEMLDDVNELTQLLY